MYHVTTFSLELHSLTTSVMRIASINIFFERDKQLGFYLFSDFQNTASFQNTFFNYSQNQLIWYMIQLYLL